MRQKKDDKIMMNHLKADQMMNKQATSQVEEKEKLDFEGNLLEDQKEEEYEDESDDFSDSESESQAKSESQANTESQAEQTERSEEQNSASEHAISEDEEAASEQNGEIPRDTLMKMGP